MSSKPFSKILKDNLSNLTPESPFGTFHIALSVSLTNWFQQILIKQIYIASGVINIYPYVAPCIRPLSYILTFNPVNLQTAFSSGPTGFPQLFKYIGEVISQQVSQWTGSPIIEGIGTGTLTTDHFYALGESFKIIISQFKPDEETVFDDIWNLFENYLRDAINKIPLLVVPISGPAVGGIFNGGGYIKLYA